MLQLFIPLQILVGEVTEGRPALTMGAGTMSCTTDTQRVLGYRTGRLLEITDGKPPMNQDCQAVNRNSGLGLCCLIISDLCY